MATTSGKPGADDQVRTYVRGTQLRLPPREEHPQGGNTSPEKHQRWLSGHRGHRPKRVPCLPVGLHTAPTHLSAGKMPGHPPASPEIAPCADPDQRKTAQA